MLPKLHPCFLKILKPWGTLGHTVVHNGFQHIHIMTTYMSIPASNKKVLQIYITSFISKQMKLLLWEAFCWHSLASFVPLQHRSWRPTHLSIFPAVNQIDWISCFKPLKKDNINMCRTIDTPPWPGLIYVPYGEESLQISTSYSDFSPSSQEETAA